MFICKPIKEKKIYLSKINNKLLIVDFWATWCPPCRMTIPKLIEINKKFKDRVEILGVSLDREISLRELKSFSKAKKINYHVGFANKEIYYYFGPIHAIPTIFLVSPNGKILDKVVGYDPNMDVKVKYYLKKLKITGKKGGKK